MRRKLALATAKCVEHWIWLPEPIVDAGWRLGFLLFPKPIKHAAFIGLFLAVKRRVALPLKWFCLLGGGFRIEWIYEVGSACE